MNESLISIIIPAKNCEETIEKCLNSVLNLEYKNYEVIVVDDASNDRTAEIIAKFAPKVKIITNKSCTGPSKARNDAVLIARGEYLTFTDSDCIVDKDWLNQLMNGFSSLPDVAGCGGVQLLPWDATNFEKKAFILMQKAGHISDYIRIVRSSAIFEVDHNPSCCVMYRKDVFLKNRGFLEGLWPGEDVEFDFRLNKQRLRLVCNPKAVVYHYKPKNITSLLKMMFRYGWAQGFLIRRYGFFRKVQFIGLFGPLILFIAFVMVAIPLLRPLLVAGIIIAFLIFKGNIFSLVLAVSGFFCWTLGFWKALLF